MKIIDKKECASSGTLSNRLVWLDVLKGIGIILVVIGHVYKNQTISNWLYSFHMPLFFFAAGWVYKRKDIITDVKRRVQTIVIPYFSFGVLILMYWQLIERRFRESDMGFWDSFFGLFFGQYDYLDFNVHLWFLPCFFVMVVFFNILVCVGGRQAGGYRGVVTDKWLAYAVSILMSIVYIACPLAGLPWGIDRVFEYIGFYAVGTALADWHSLSWHRVADRFGSHRGGSALVAVILLAVSIVLAYFNLTSGIFWYVTALIGVAAVFTISRVINDNRILQYFGRISLVVLCVHGPVYRIVVKLTAILLHIGTDMVRNNFILSVLVVAVTMSICCAIYEVLVRILPYMVGKNYPAPRNTSKTIVLHSDYENNQQG